VTPDGTVIVGYSAVEGGYEAFRWTQGGGMVTLGDLPGGAIHGGASDVSADGLVIVGAGTTASGYEAFIWTQSGGMVGLGDLPGGPTVSGATACSDDGSVVVGAANYDQATDFGDAFIWTADRGMRYLKDEIIATRCVPEIAGFRLVAATGISGDGRVVVGNAINPDGDLEAFIIRLDAAPTPPPCRADFNGDHAVNSQDFFDFLAAFFAGC
jgi:probable HAF family extracellular repeat protein